MENRHGLKMEEDSTNHSASQKAMDAISSTNRSSDTGHTTNTQTLYARKLGCNVSRGSSEATFSGSEPVEHDEEGEGLQSKERPSDFCVASQSSGYDSSWDSKPDHPVLDRLPHDPDVVMRSFMLRSSTSSRRSSSQMSDFYPWECE
jgi:hypothetical protein